MWCGVRTTSACPAVRMMLSAPRSGDRGKAAVNHIASTQQSESWSGAMNQPNGAHFFDRYDRFIGTMRAAGGPGAGAAELARMRHRYDAIVANNRDLFRGAKVLDIKSANGFWSLVALDAGAARVVGLEAARKPFEAAKQTLAELPFNPSSYEFVNTEIPP